MKVQLVEKVQQTK